MDANYVPVEQSRRMYPPQLNPPTERRMVSGTVLSSSSLDACLPPGQVIRLECSPREHGQIYHNAFQHPAASYIEASYQPPPPIHATYQPPPPQRTQNNARRALPGNAARTLPAMDPPSYNPPPSPTRKSSRFSPSPPTFPPNSISASQSLSRSHSLAFTELPEYSYGGVSYSPIQIAPPPVQIPISFTSFPAAVHPESAQYPETTSYQTPSTAQSPRATSSLVRVPDLPIEYTNISVSTDNGPNSRYSGVGNGSSLPSSPTRNAFHPPASPLLPSGSSDSSGEKSSTSSGVPNISSTSFIFPGSRSVARPTALPKTKTPSKSWRWKDLAGKSSLSEVPHSLPPLNTALSSTTLPNSSEATIASEGSSNPKNTKHVLPRFPDRTYYETSSVFSHQSTSHKTSTSSTSGNPTPVSVFPVGRSRAQPKLVPRGSKGQVKPKLSGGPNSGENNGKRTGFMGMLLKKKTKAPKSVDGSNRISIDSPVASGPTKEAITPAKENKLESYQVIQAPTPKESREQAKRMKSRIGKYPLNPYDSVLLDNDRHTGELLARLNPTGTPSFHNYGNNPPSSVLDLGCGQGHWVVDAAIAWKGYGTKVTGYDMVDVSQALLPYVIEQGVTDNVQFVRGNFLKQRLPFSNDSFDLVRMSCLALCITSDSWIFVLQEVCRVLMVGGRLELIDDLIFFPYGKQSTSLDIPVSALNPRVPSLAPRLDISIPSSSFRTFSIYAGETNNPGLGLPVDNEEAKDFYELHGVEEEDIEDTATLNERSNVHAFVDPSHNPRARAPPQTRTYTSSSSDIDLQSWTRAHNASEDLEDLFEHMLLHKFGINKNPSEFVLGLMKEVFGHAREVETMQLTLAPPKTGVDNGDASREHLNASIQDYMLGGGRSSSRESMGLSESPGLILWPSTFIPMDQSEIEIHASKHLRMLLSCEKFLVEHAIEVTNDEEMDERAMLEALGEYESFLRRRFNPPTLPSDDRGSDSGSIQGSGAEPVSSDVLDAMREIESELRPRFSWQESASRDRLVPATPSTPIPVDQVTAPKFPPSAPVPTASTHRLRDTDVSNGSLTSYHAEITHVRTFRIYEAIKIADDEAIFGLSALGLSGLSL